MNNLKPITLLTLLAFILAGCNHNLCCVIPDNPDGIFAEYLNNQFSGTQVSVGYASKTGKDSIVITGRDQYNEVMTLKFRADTGKYIPKATDAYCYVTDGTGAISTKYRLDTRVNNFIRVQKLDKTYGECTGIFNLSFRQIYPTTTEHLMFSNGRFKLHTQDGYLNSTPY